MTDELRRKEQKRRRRAMREARALNGAADPSEVRDSATGTADSVGPPVAELARVQATAAAPTQSPVFAEKRAASTDAADPVVLTIAYGQSNAEAGGLRRHLRRQAVEIGGGAKERRQTRRNAGSPDTQKQVLDDQVLIDTIADRDDAATGKLGLGRALMVGRSDVVDECRALMLNTGLLGVQGRELDGATLTDFVPAQENADVGESGGCAYLRHSLIAADPIGDSSAAHLYRSSGQAGQLLCNIAEGTQAFRNFLTTVDRSIAICKRYGKRLYLPHFLWDHGEEDRKRGTDPMLYRAQMIELRNRLDVLIRERTQQAEPVWMLATILVAPAVKRKAKSNAQIPLAQVAALSEPGIAPVCSPYWFHGDYGFFEGQAVHWAPLAKALLREFGARAARIVREAMLHDPAAKLGDPIRRRMYDPEISGGGGGWSLRELPFETCPRTDERSVKRVGDEVSGTVVFAERGLQIVVDERGAARNFGFEWSGTGEIVSVEVETRGQLSRWKLRLSAGSPGRLTYAVEPQKVVAAKNCPQTWGNVFDACAEPSLAVPGLTLRQGLLPFSVDVD
ncbi:hypothetical protein [Hydrocarboniphaga sp.]|uniref:hypothetical protein n=1 Tax=Hydrocarboniphaga sp. TaxID=2033016 RepID=UPI0026371741|nr:hypothetical protein [Hydrocarboniphaga sp.]